MRDPNGSSFSYFHSSPIEFDGQKDLASKDRDENDMWENSTSSDMSSLERAISPSKGTKRS